MAALDGAADDVVKRLKQDLADARAAIEPEPELVGNPLVPLTKGEGAINSSKAQRYDAYLLDANGQLYGTARLTVGRPNKKTRLASVRLTVRPVGKKAMLFKSTERNGRVFIPANNATTIKLANHEQTLTLKIGTEGVEGTWAAYTIYGVRNRSRKDAAYAPWTGTKSVVLPVSDGTYDTYSFRIKANGTVKVGGTTADGKSVSTTCQLLLSEDGEKACVAVVGTKKHPFGFALWLKPGKDGTIEETVESVHGGGDGIAGDAVPAWKSMTFTAGDVRVGLSWNQRRIVVPKRDKVKLVNGNIVSIDSHGNQPGLQLSYVASTGAFKGRYTAYHVLNGRLNRKTVTVRGVFVDGVGYGTAFVRGAAPVAVRIK